MKHIFIVNPYAGKKNFADNMRKHIAEIKNLDYLIFNTRYEGYERELVQKITKMFPDEKLRFYSCGGSGTLRNMLDGFADVSKAELAFYPCGLTNDFLKAFGGQEKRFHDIEELIDGEVIQVDYIQTNHGRCLNTCSTGVDLRVVANMNSMRVTQFLGNNIPYLIAIMRAVLTSKREEYEITVDGMELSGRYMEVFMGNGQVLGGTNYFSPKALPNDGLLGCSFFRTPRGLRTVRALMATQSKDYAYMEKVAHLIEAKRITVRHKDGSPVNMNQDGELVTNFSSWEIRVVPKGLSLVVPKGVRL